METVRNVDELAEKEHPLTEEQRRLVRDGGLATQFIDSPYWSLLISRTEAQCRIALQEMFDCESSDDHVIANFWRRWKAAEKQRQGLENHFMALKEDYELALQEAKHRHEAPQVPADDLSGSSEI